MKIGSSTNIFVTIFVNIVNTVTTPPHSVQLLSACKINSIRTQRVHNESIMKFVASTFNYPFLSILLILCCSPRGNALRLV